jgi:hypothetical protein
MGLAVASHLNHLLLLILLIPIKEETLKPE